MDAGFENRIFTASAFISKAQDSTWISVHIYLSCHYVIHSSSSWYRDGATGKLCSLRSCLLPGLTENGRCRGPWKQPPCCGHKEKKIWAEVFGPASADMGQFSSSVNKNPSWKIWCLNLEEETYKELWHLSPAAFLPAEKSSPLPASDLVDDPCELREM